MARRSRPRRYTALSISKLVGNKEPTLAADMHANEAGIPACNDAVSPDRSWRRKGAAMIVGRIEFRSVRGQPACVLHAVELAAFR